MRSKERWELGEKEKKRREKSLMTLGQCVGLIFLVFLVENITEWWVPNEWGLWNLGILSDERWVTSNEW